MHLSFTKQNLYPAPIDGLFIVKITNFDENVAITDNTYMDIIGKEFTLDFQSYKVITIMQDIPTGDYFALCKLLISELSYNKE